MAIIKEEIRLVVVDDDPIILDVFSKMIKQVRYHADFFISPTEALETIMAHPKRYNLMITDICMPQDDGIAFAKKVRAANPDLPVMFMTGGATPEKKEEALSLGRVTFLEKPFPLIQVLGENIALFIENK